MKRAESIESIRMQLAEAQKEAQEAHVRVSQLGELCLPQISKYLIGRELYITLLDPLIFQRKRNRVDRQGKL
jgi:demethoxyubiquinone hydroxylase (CLK1/Coq7/Cat5 family)